MIRRTLAGLGVAAGLTLSAALVAPPDALGQSVDATSLYQFQAGQTMRYDVDFAQDGDRAQGFYQVSVEDGGGGQVQVRVEASVGENSCNTTSSVAPGPAVGGQMMMSCLMLAPVAAALYAPMWTAFLGQSWTVGNSWTMGNVSVTVPERCSYAGQTGVRMLMTEDGEERIDTCYAEALPLPLYVRLVTDSDSYVEMRATAVERD